MASSLFATGGVQRWQFGYLAPCLSFLWSSQKNSVANYLRCASFFLMGPPQHPPHRPFQCSLPKSMSVQSCPNIGPYIWWQVLSMWSTMLSRWGGGSATFTFINERHLYSSSTKISRSTNWFHVDSICYHSCRNRNSKIAVLEPLFNIFQCHWATSYLCRNSYTHVYICEIRLVHLK